MNVLDVGLLVLAALLAGVGLLKGLTRLLVGIAALVAAFFLAALLHEAFAARLAGWFRAPRPALLLAAYFAIFVGTLLVGGGIAFIARRLVKAAMLGWADRLAGAALGLVAAALVAAVLVLPVVAYAPAGAAMLETSVLAPYVAVVADLVSRLAPEGLSRAYRERIEAARHGS
jgi:membrane protein required for colicin V production